MELPDPKINISVQLGQDTGQAMLAKVHFINHVGAAEVSDLKHKAKLGGDSVGQNLVCLIRYYVHPGREGEALKYLQDGFERSIAKDELSPLQFITLKHEDEQIQSNIYSQPGQVCVRYKFPLDQELMQIAAKLEQVNKFKMEVQLKGSVSHTMKNRTNVKVDYSYINLTADEIPDQQFLNGMLIQNQMIPPEVTEHPLYATAGKARKLHLCLRLKSFRQISKYHDQMAKQIGNSLKKESKNDFRYTAPGLFREKVEAYAFLQDQVAASADITHQGEDIFLRLIKVYFKAAKKCTSDL